MGKSNSRLKYLAKNTFIFTLGNLGTKLIAFFLVPLYTGVLSKEEYGTADLMITIASFVVPILICNINESIMRFMLDKNSNSDTILSTGFLIMGAMCVCSTACIPLIRIYPPFRNHFLYVYFYFISMGVQTILLYNLRGKEQLLHFSIGSIIHALSIALLNILFLLVFNWRLEGFLLSYILGNILTIIYAAIAGNVFKSLKNFKIDKRLTKEMLKFSVVLIPNSFMWWIMNSSDRIMLTAMSGIAISGLYAVSSKIPALVSMVSSIFNQAWNYSAIKEDESRDKDDYNNKVFTFLLAVTSIISLGVLLILKPFMKFYVSTDYYEAWKYSPPIIVGTLFLVLATFLSSQYTVKKDSKGFLFSSTAGAGINILLNFILIPMIGGLGAAVATGISYVTVYLYRAIDTKKYFSVHIFDVRNVIVYIAVIAGAVAVYLDNLLCYFIIGALLLFTIFSFRIEFFSAWEGIKMKARRNNDG